MVKRMIDAYFQENSLVKQHLDSYNKFVETGIQEIIDRIGKLSTNVEGFEIKLGKVRIEPPRFYEVRGGYRPILPSECRLRNITYASPIFLEMTPVFNGVERPVYSDVFIGELPVMVKSKLCHLSRMSREELVEAGEDPEDPGGYFIINGSERVLVSVEDLVPNKILTTVEEGREVVAKVFSTRHGFRARCVVSRSKDGKWTIDFPASAPGISLFTVLRVLGAEMRDIRKLFTKNLLIQNDVLVNMEYEKALNYEDPVDYLSRRLSPGQPEEYRLNRMWTLIDNYLLPHLGTEKADRERKIMYLVRMAERTTLVYHKRLAPDDKDHYGNKRVKLAGELMEELFRYAFQFLTKDIVYQASRADARGRRLQVHTLIRQDALTDRIRYAMATGNWIAGQTGVSQLLDRTSYLASLSHRRRVISPLSRRHPHFKARDLHGTHYGKICPSETPEGPSCSLVKNLAVFAEVSVGTDELPVEELLRAFGVSEQVKGTKKSERTVVYLNGRLVGYYKDGKGLVERLREKRRTNELSPQVNVYFKEQTNELFINTDKGRVRRPYIVVENGKSKLTREIAERLNKKQLTWSHLIKMGVIEYLDAEEEENAYVAMKEEELTPEHTHLEIDGSTIFSVVSSILPYPEHNSSPRITMACSMAKQSLGLYASNYNQRFDTRSYVMYYPQEPAVTTDLYKALNLRSRAAGQNFVVALATYSGYNMADGIIISKAAIERGLGRVAMFRTYETEERVYPGGQKDKIEIPTPDVVGYRGEEAYRHLDEDGVVIPESTVGPKDVLVGKTSPPRFLEEVSIFGVIEEKKRENSLAVKAGESGKVDSVMITEGMSGNKVIKVRLRSEKVPEVGDKFASRHGQKGVIGLILNHEEMPFTKDGIVPDVIINPHAIPSRMTAGHLLEMLGGKASAISGMLMDGTAFSGNKEEEYTKILKEAGFDEYGEEVMYDGETGKPLKAKIFIGVAYYQRLHHLVSNKMHVRSRGPVQLLTLQPTEGRVREGGLRFGEMERDCLIGYGASMLIRERLLEESDKTTMLICKDCGGIAVTDYVRKRSYCGVCKSENVGEVEMSYAFKLLVDEIQSMGVFPRIIIKEKGESG